MPTTFASAKQFVGLAKETTHGTAVAPTTTVPVDDFVMDESREQLKDQAWRGHMGTVSGIVQGVGKTEFDIKGPVFLDTLPHLLYNLLGDLTTTGSAPKVHTVALLNTGSAQPPSHTFTHFQGPATTVGARRVSGGCLAEMTLKWDAESELFTLDGKGTGWTTSLPGSAPTSSPSTVTPLAAWRATLSIGGSPVTNVSSAEVSFKRALKPSYTLSGAQDPYIISRGTVECTGKMTFIADSESPLLAFLNNTQPALSLSIGNGLSAGSLQQLVLDIDKAAYSSAKFSAGNEAAEYEVEFEAVSTATNAGASGGMTPAKVTVTNSVASY